MDLASPDPSNSSPFLSKEMYNETMPSTHQSPPLSPQSSPGYMPSIDGLPLVKLRQMSRGFYDVYGMNRRKAEYPRLVVMVGEQLHLVYTNADLKLQASDLNLANASSATPIARLHILYHERTATREKRTVAKLVTI